MAQKFIITSDGRFRWGEVRMHRDLLQVGDVCLGGGFYQFDYVNSRMLLDRASYDYGRPQWSRLKQQNTRLKVSPELQGFSLVWLEGYHNPQEVDIDEWIGIDWV